jgi:hypothetical protein
MHEQYKVASIERRRIAAFHIFTLRFNGQYLLQQLYGLFIILPFIGEGALNIQ